MGTMRYDFKTLKRLNVLRMNCWPKTDAAATENLVENHAYDHVAEPWACD